MATASYNSTPFWCRLTTANKLPFATTELRHSLKRRTSRFKALLREDAVGNLNDLIESFNEDWWLWLVCGVVTVVSVMVFKYLSQRQNGRLEPKRALVENGTDLTTENCEPLISATLNLQMNKM